jgi:hypothetical protein
MMMPRRLPDVNPRSAIRRLVYVSEKTMQAARFAALPEPSGGWPALLGISFPKSGTHLLDQILLGFSSVAPFSRRLHSFYAEYEGDTGRSRPASEARAWVERLGPRDVASAHLFARPEVVQRVATPAIVSYFIFRDPRDVVVSHVHYVTDMESRHVHHAYYASLPDFESRLRVSILGRGDLDIEFPDIAARFAPYMGWLDSEAVMAVHFEDLVDDRPTTLGAIIAHFLKRVPLSTPQPQLMEALETSIDPQRSPTFRSGKTGEWRRHFTPEIKDLFKGVAGDLLLRLGYETTTDW